MGKATGSRWEGVEDGTITQSEPEKKGRQRGRTGAGRERAGDWNQCSDTEKQQHPKQARGTVAVGSVVGMVRYTGGRREGGRWCG